MKVTVDLKKMSGDKTRAWWFNPRIGEATEIGEFDTDRGATAFEPPGEPARGNDWVLVLDDASQKFPPPGSEAL